MYKSNKKGIPIIGDLTLTKNTPKTALVSKLVSANNSITGSTDWQQYSPSTVTSSMDDEEYNTYEDSITGASTDARPLPFVKTERNIFDKLAGNTLETIKKPTSTSSSQLYEYPYKRTRVERTQKGYSVVEPGLKRAAHVGKLHNMFTKRHFSNPKKKGTKKILRRLRNAVRTVVKYNKGVRTFTTPKLYRTDIFKDSDNQIVADCGEGTTNREVKDIYTVLATELYEAHLAEVNFAKNKPKMNRRVTVREGTSEWVIERRQSRHRDKQDHEQFIDELVNFSYNNSRLTARLIKFIHMYTPVARFIEEIQTRYGIKPDVMSAYIDFIINNPNEFWKLLVRKPQSVLLSGVAVDRHRVEHGQGDGKATEQQCNETIGKVNENFTCPYCRIHINIKKGGCIASCEHGIELFAFHTIFGISPSNGSPVHNGLLRHVGGYWWACQRCNMIKSRGAQSAGGFIQFDNATALFGLNYEGINEFVKEWFDKEYYLDPALPCNAYRIHRDKLRVDPNNRLKMKQNLSTIFTNLADSMNARIRAYSLHINNPENTRFETTPETRLNEFVITCLMGTARIEAAKKASVAAAASNPKSKKDPSKAYFP